MKVNEETLKNLPNGEYNIIKDNEIIHKVDVVDGTYLGSIASGDLGTPTEATQFYRQVFKVELKECDIQSV